MTNNLFLDHDDISRAVEAIANPLDHLVGEGRKFKTPDDLAKGKLHSDLMIDKMNVERNDWKMRNETLQAELDKLRDDSKKTLEALGREAPQGSQNNEGSQNKMITETEIEQLVSNKLQAERDADRRRTNVETVRTQLQSTWGDKWQETLENAANEFGGKEELARMAEVNPKALLKLIGGKEPQANTQATNLFNTPPTSTVRPTLPQGGDVKGEKYFAKMRKENPNRYFTGEAFAERVEAMTRLGNDYSKH